MNVKMLSDWVWWHTLIQAIGRQKIEFQATQKNCVMKKEKYFLKKMLYKREGCANIHGEVRTEYKALVYCVYSNGCGGFRGSRDLLKCWQGRKKVVLACHS